LAAAISGPDLQALIEKCLLDFYKRRYEALTKLNLTKVLKRKNPYLFRAVGTEKASEIVERLLQAYMSSSDETIFGDAYFEQVAWNLPGIKTTRGEGADLEVETKDEIHVYAQKSGPNPFNAAQKAKQDTQFKSIQSRLGKLHKRFDPVLAYSYGKTVKPADAKHIYRETAGQAFWTELTGDSDFYLKLIRLMNDIPTKHKHEYQSAWDAAVNRFTQEFLEEFCVKGVIQWEKLTTFVSGAD
jgi:Type II restriction endonuclease EcoO109I